MNEGVSLRRVLESALQFWWIFFIVMLGGAGISAGFQAARPPLYEAYTEISTTIDFGRTGLLSDIEQDQMVGMVGDVIASQPVVEAALQAASLQGVELNVAQFRSQSFLERRGTAWMLRVRHSQPQQAAQLANHWAQASMDALTTAYHHAVQADSLYRYMLSLESCLEQTAASRPSEALCTVQNLDEIQFLLETSSRAQVEERTASQGISAALSFQHARVASPPEQPAQFGRNSLLLAGALIGLLLAVGLFAVGLPERIRKHRVS